MIEIKCPACDAGGRVPRDKMTTRLVCKKCLAVFHLGPSGKPIRGEPPVRKDAPKEKDRGESGGAIELGGSFDGLTQSFSKIKLPRVSGRTAGIAAAVVLIAALGFWLFSKQSLQTRAELVARAVMSPESVKAAIDVSVPDTVFDVIKWHSEASQRYGALKIALGGQDAGLNLNVLSDGSNGRPAIVVAQFSAEGTRLGAAGVETLQPSPSLANTESTLQEHLYFVKDSFGNWLLDGTRTLNDKP